MQFATSIEHPDFVFHLPGVGRRYSRVVADWILDEYALDPLFFQTAGVADPETLRLRKRKAR